MRAQVDIIYKCHPLGTEGGRWPGRPRSSVRAGERSHAQEPAGYRPRGQRWGRPGEAVPEQPGSRPAAGNQRVEAPDIRPGFGGCAVNSRHIRGRAGAEHSRGRRGPEVTPSSSIPETGRKSQVSELSSRPIIPFGYAMATISSPSTPERGQSRRSQPLELHGTTGVPTRWSGAIRSSSFDPGGVSRGRSPVVVTRRPKLETTPLTTGETL